MKTFSNKNSFTLVETIVAIVMISVWLVWVISVINYWISFIWKTEQRMIAINLAREWIETIYNIRDTNRLIWWGKKDQCWLKTNPFDTESDNICDNDEWMQEANYIISWNQLDWQQYFSLSWIDNTYILNVNNWIQDEDREYIMCMEWWLWVNCNNWWWFIKEWMFFRKIQWLGLFDKTSTDPNQMLSCSKWTDVGCGNTNAKEYRFCSIVQYSSKSLWEIKFCWILTNFQ